MKVEYEFETVDNTMLEYDKIRNISNSETRISVRAKAQNAGIGRENHPWYSPEGGLWFTFDVLSPHFVPSFALYAGFCLHRLLQRLYGLPELRIKWTNDLFWNDHKLAGLLCRHQPATKSYVIGLGLNTNNIQDPLMKEYRAISLRDILGFDVSTEWLRRLFIHEVWSMAVLLETPQVYLDYCNAHLYGKGRKASVDGPSGIVEGVIRGVDSLGYLQIEDKGLHSVCFGSIVKLEDCQV
jgi:BirA family biotin operon repressor/biotin-[acetyl-CoA-carboxylase] ligase